MYGCHDSDERGLSSQCRQDSTELTWSGYIQQVLCALQSNEIYIFQFLVEVSLSSVVLIRRAP